MSLLTYLDFVSPLTFVAVYIVMHFYLLWLLYVFYTACMWTHKEGLMTWYLWTLALPALAAGYLLDLAGNVLFSALVWDRPKWGEWTISLHIERLLLTPGRRREIGLKIAKILDPFDLGRKHIKTPTE